MAVGGSWHAVDDQGVVVAVKPGRAETIELVSNAGTPEYPVRVVVRREDGTIEEERSVP